MATTAQQSNPTLQRTTTASMIRTATTTTTATQAICTWPGHCLGVACLSNDDCDNDWVCNNEVCSLCCVTASVVGTSTRPTASSAITDTPKKELAIGSVIGIVVAVAVMVAIFVGMGITWWCWRRRKSISRASSTAAGSQVFRDQLRTSPTVLQQSFIAESMGDVPLPGPQRPAELPSHELIELEGDYKTTIQQIDISHKLLPSIPQ